MGLNPLSIVGSVADLARNVLDRFWPEKASETEKAAAVAELERLFQAREETLVNASRDIIVAEMQSGDTWTKRARPSIIYAGLLVLLFNAVGIPVLRLVPAFSGLSPVDMPDVFWEAWKLVAAVWAGGRTLERLGLSNRVTRAITGGNGNGV